MFVNTFSNNLFYNLNEFVFIANKERQLIIFFLIGLQLMRFSVQYLMTDIGVMLNLESQNTGCDAVHRG